MYVHVHALALIRYIVIPVEQHVTELAALLPRLNPHFGSLCVKNTTFTYGEVCLRRLGWRD